MKKPLTIIAVAGAIALVICAVGAGVLTFVVLRNPMISSGLERIGSDFSAMVALQRQVAEAFPADEVGVKIQNGRSLIVTLVNGMTDAATHDDGWESAEDVAGFVFDNYAA